MLLAALALWAGAAQAAAQTTPLAAVAREFRAHGVISPCRFALAELRAARHAGPQHPRLATPAFKRALRAAITARKQGACAQAKPAPKAPAATPPATPRARAGGGGSGEGTSLVLLAIAFAAGAAVAGTAAWLAMRRRAREPAEAARSAAASAGYRSALRRRDLRLLLGGLVVSATGSWAYSVALLAFVFAKTHSLTWVGAASLARFIPALVFSPYAGVVADRFERVRVMAASDLLCVAFQVGLTLVAAFDGPVLAAVVLAGLTAVANVVYNPAVAAMIPEVAGERDLAAANALNGTVENLVVIAGPAIGAGLLALGSPALAFGVNAATFGVSALLVTRMRTRSTPVDVSAEGGEGPLAQMLVGVKTIAGMEAARLLVAFCALVSFVYGTDTVLLVGASERLLGTGPDGFGYLLAGLGVGGVLTATIVNRLASSARLAAIITAGVAVYCVPTALLTIVHEPTIAFVIEVVRGGGTLVVDVLAITALQRAVPGDQVARVFGVFFAFVLGAISLGALIAPPIVSALGLRGGLLVLGFGPPLLGLLGYPALARLDRAAAARLRELTPRITVLEGLGIFAAANRPVLERLAAAVSEVTVPAGTTLIQEGDEADALYVLNAGHVDVTARGEAGGPPKRLRTMGPGTYFGEIGLLERIPRTATVVTTEACECYRIEGDAFLAALVDAPPAASLMEGARTRLARTHPSRRVTFEPADAAAAGQ
jgi:CRP-like cAMP-binding protein/MFS family permease